MAEKEIKFVVIKIEDIKNYLLEDDRERMVHLLNYLQARANTKDHKYVVINNDEPYIDKVWKVILDGEKEKNEARGRINRETH